MYITDMKNNSYINKNAVLTYQLQLHQKIKHINHLKSQLYIKLNNPFRVLKNVDEDDGYILGSFIIWQDEKQAESILINNSYNNCLDSQIREYQILLETFGQKEYNRPNYIQLRLIK